VTAYEVSLGHRPRDVSSENLGYDIESLDPRTGHLRFIEVKGRAEGATTLTLTRNEILTALNKPESWWLAIVLIKNGQGREPVYIKEPFKDGIPFSAAVVDIKLKDLNL
jgi:hypothetical protein